MRSIAHASNVSEKSIYRYFNTKVELILETVVVLWREIIAELCSAIGENYDQLDGYRQIEALLEGFRNLYEAHASYVLFAYEYKLYLIRHSAKITKDMYNDILRPIRDVYLPALEKGLSDGSIAAKASPRDLYTAIWGLMRGYVVKIVIYDRMYEGRNFWREQYALACGLILSGLRNGFPGKSV